MVFGRTRLTPLAPVGTPCRTCRTFARVRLIDRSRETTSVVRTGAPKAKARALTQSDHDASAETEPASSSVAPEVTAAVTWPPAEDRVAGSYVRICYCSD
jgi:hypothetical protein